MVNGSKIVSNLQFLMMMIGFVTPFGHFVYIALVFHDAGKDAWLSLVCSALLGAGIVYLHFKSAARQPDLSLITYSVKVFGNWVGGMIGSIYIVFFLLSTSITIHIFVQFVSLLFPLTPHAVFTFIFIFVIAYVLYSGVEVLARSIQLSLPFLMILGLVASLLVAKDRDFSQILPILENGVFPAWQGCLIFVAMFAELVVFRMLIPHTNEPQKLPKQGLLVMGILLLMFMGPTTGPITLFGEDLAKSLLYPTFEEIRYIDVADFIQRIDIFGLFLWIIGTYYRVSIFLFGAAKGLADLMKANKDITYVLPVILCTFAMEQSLKSYTPGEMYKFLIMGYVPISLFVGIALPFFTDIVSLIRSSWKPKWNIAKR
ncbi:spore germination protein [Fodinisporobacter ferrooxydans]|uniref:Spore germination protein n=1 Tax=Fodinisporobacter ferrooxydans TaxID=2901836 RepID=A0ABY4CEA4_9BACL|nr:spore germination protein [Alicyclobacillaceae bacterium MYW30-H2]